MSAGARFSRDRRYRYRLWRRWDRSRPSIAFCMLNPSTADERSDDPTIRRCIGFARAWGYGGVEVVNLFALRATDPRELRRARDPVGERNDAYLRSAAGRSAAMVVAWGVHGALLARDVRALATLSRRARLLALGWTKSGAPRHPLYLRRDARPLAVGAGR
ncbi:MAG TPA: DUF1643 domain-containing protein [Candidatus Limnocylindria bacterium]|nr:DUF1643 domain-containing protein [Candidatus Limnocylindria bacterium]